MRNDNDVVTGTVGLELKLDARLVHRVRQRSLSPDTSSTRRPTDSAVTVAAPKYGVRPLPAQNIDRILGYSKVLNQRGG